jgi:hypothetical protein
MTSFAGMKVILLLILLGILVVTQVNGETSVAIGMPCANAKIQARRSAELQRIRAADQADRAWQTSGANGSPQPTLAGVEKMSRNDLQRRKRVGEILGEGCFKSADDYEAAFVVYQHGNTSDQYFQAFLWSQQALKLGNTKVKPGVALAIDRYLVSIGHKELFGTQAFAADLGHGCWCIQPVEDSFPDSRRSEYRGGADTAYTGLSYLRILNQGTNCPTSYCNTNLLPSPEGSVPGFW